jgi:Zn-dependent peptidase ImmA (M78 family)
LNVIKPFQKYSSVELETIASNLRLEVEQNRRRRLSADSIAEGIADFLDLSIMWENIPADRQGDIAAMIFPTKQTIVINSSVSLLENSGYRQSTIAHEIGHWILHIDRQAVGEYIDRLEQGIEMKIQPFLCRSVQYLEGIEWQAQHFAGCLLMPEDKLIKAARGRDLTNRKHLYALANEFGVTISNLTYRLKSLKWIILNNGSKQIYLGSNAPK